MNRCPLCGASRITREEVAALRPGMKVRFGKRVRMVMSVTDKYVALNRIIQNGNRGHPLYTHLEITERGALADAP